MLERVTAGPIVFYRSPLLAGIGVPHAFSTRHGGISAAPFDSMNLGNPSGCDVQDDYENVWENYRLLQEACGLGGRALARAHQVHGAEVIVDSPGETFDISKKADGIVTTDRAKVISIRVADCTPVLLASSDGRVVGAVHAGWRGTVAGVLLRTIEQMRTMTTAPLVAAIGPAISGEAFEVGSEVADEFRKAFGDDAPILPLNASGKPHVDIRRALELQLNQSGIDNDHIDRTDRCTFHDRDEFFSHRRDRGITGRMAALISVA